MALDQNTLQELKTKLLDEKARLTGELTRFAKPVGQDNFETTYQDMGADRDDNATEVEEYSDNVALENTLEHQLKEVDAALDRMEQGTYGVCEETGQEIPVERLRVYPAARTVAHVPEQ